MKLIIKLITNDKFKNVRYYIITRNDPSYTGYSVTNWHSWVFRNYSSILFDREQKISYFYYTMEKYHIYYLNFIFYKL